MAGWSIYDYINLEEPLKEFRLHILVDKEEFRRFPSLKNQPLKDDYVIFDIHNNKYSEKNYAQFFDMLPKEFLKDKKGVLVHPVELLVNNYMIRTGPQTSDSFSKKLVEFLCC